MSDGTATAEQPKVKMKTWSIEADHPRNCDLWVQNIPGTRLRGALNGNKPVIDQKTRQPMLPVDQVRNLGPLPPLPGMQLFINPQRCEYVISDPLADEPELLQRFASMVAENQALRPDVQPVPLQRGQLNQDQVKTLCREMLQFVQAGEAKLASGNLPTMAEIDELPGDYLLNPGLLTWTSQPLHEKDFDSWARGESVKR